MHAVFTLSHDGYPRYSMICEFAQLLIGSTITLCTSSLLPNSPGPSGLVQQSRPTSAMGGKPLTNSDSDSEEEEGLTSRQTATSGSQEMASSTTEASQTGNNVHSSESSHFCFFILQ